jgi:hypothetical protein
MAESRTVNPLVLEAIDLVWARVRARLGGLSQQEYLWEPVPDCWSVRESGGRVLVDWSGDDPDPAPFTTIAWRLCHLSADCFASYTVSGLGDWPLATPHGEWVLEVEPALAAFDTAWSAFRGGLDRLASLDGPASQTRTGTVAAPAAGGSAEQPNWTALALHAMDELAHHGAEIALLRDLYLHTPELAERGGR